MKKYILVSSILITVLLITFILQSLPTPSVGITGIFIRPVGLPIPFYIINGLSNEGLNLLFLLIDILVWTYFVWGIVNWKRFSGIKQIVLIISLSIIFAISGLIFMIISGFKLLLILINF